MEQYEKEMEIIALLSNIDEGYTYIDCDTDVVEHVCERTGEKTELQLVEVEYFREGRIMEDKANFCEHCNQVFVYKP